MNETPVSGQPVVTGDKSRMAGLTSPLILWPAAILLGVLFYFGLSMLNDGMSGESTDDAFIAGHIISIAPKVAGQVAAVHVFDNQLVHSNDLLVEIDPRDYETTLSQKRASVRTSEANLKAVMGVLDLMLAKVATAEATARQAHLQSDASAATATNAHATLERDEPLIKNGAISEQDFEDAQAADRSASATHKADEQNAVAQDSKVTEARATWTATQAGVDLAKAQLSEAEAVIATSELNLSYTKIVAPYDGTITRKQVESGDYLAVGQTIMSIVPKDVWVVANFKESQLRKMKPGQPATVNIDAVGGKVFRAHVDSVQAGSGAAFSLLPPENATGNFVKVVQRVPVKIFFDEPLPEGNTLGPGLSVDAEVRVGTFDAPKIVLVLIAAILAIIAALIFRSLVTPKAGNR